MSITITVPREIETELQDKAMQQNLSVEELAIALLSHALDREPAFPTPEEVVAEIQSMQPNPIRLRPANGSLAEALRDAPDDPDFDLSVWNQEWAMVEAEMKMMSRTRLGYDIG